MRGEIMNYNNPLPFGFNPFVNSCSTCNLNPIDPVQSLLPVQPNMNPMLPQTPSNNNSYLELNNQMRKLWMEHVVWTKLAIMSMASDSQDTSFVSERLLRNAPDIGKLFATYYGPVIGQQYSELLKQHLLIAADLVNAAKRGDSNAVQAIDKKWHENADQISLFLNQINPNFEQNETRQMLYHHLTLTKAEAVAILTKNYSNTITLFDQIEEQALGMADEYSKAIYEHKVDNSIIDRLYI